MTKMISIYDKISAFPLSKNGVTRYVAIENILINIINLYCAKYKAVNKLLRNLQITEHAKAKMLKICI